MSNSLSEQFRENAQDHYHRVHDHLERGDYGTAAIEFLGGVYNQALEVATASLGDDPDEADASDSADAEEAEDDSDE